MGFSEKQAKVLSSKLNAKHVKQRTKNGVTLSYIEGWHAINEANRIFGFDGWDRETIDNHCIWENANGKSSVCAYTSRVRITVRTGDGEIRREGSGFGKGYGATPGDAHELAVKEAETDAMKRALMTFGNQFGLALYDREQRAVRGTKLLVANWQGGIADEKGNTIETFDQPSKYYSKMRVFLENHDAISSLEAFWANNQASVRGLKEQRPDLIDDRGIHYSAILTELLEKKRSCLEGKEQVGKPPEMQNRDSLTEGVSVSSAGSVKPSRLRPQNLTSNNFRPTNRKRDPEHLRHVASQNCLICGRSPSHAHHVKIAEPRAMGRKVGDQWTVPLCAFHHRALHDAGNEQNWWESMKVDPLATAEALWHKSKPGPSVVQPQ